MPENEEHALLLDALRALPERRMRLASPYLPGTVIDTSLALTMLDGLAGVLDLATAPALERSLLWRIVQALRVGREYGDPLHSVALLLQLEALTTHPHATIAALSDVRGMLGAALIGDGHA